MSTFEAYSTCLCGKPAIAVPHGQHFIVRCSDETCERVKHGHGATKTQAGVQWQERICDVLNDPTKTKRTMTFTEKVEKEPIE
jgi:hypothetical protein